MFTIARGALRLFVRHWPALLAWYLFGHLAHHFLVNIAATVGAVSALGGLLILPLAALARLTGFVGMFLALRPSLHGFNELSRESSSLGLGYNASLRSGSERPLLSRSLQSSREFVQIVSATVLPFFGFYAAWRYLEDDLSSYVAQAFNLTDFSTELGNVILNAGTNPLTVSVVAIALVARLLLNRFASRLPNWMRLLSVYFEAVWVFLAANVLVKMLDGVPEWFERRTVVVWSEQRLDELRTLLPPLGWAQEAVAWAIAEFGALVFLPFAWLAIAAILYGRAIALHSAATSATRKTAHARKTRKQQGSNPGILARLRTEMLTAIRQLRAEIAPVFASVRIIAGAGLAPFGIFVLLYTVVDGLAAWLTFGITRLVGAHELSWWQSNQYLLTVVVLLIAEPLRVAVIAASYDYSLHVLDARQDAQATMTPEERLKAVSGISSSEAASTRSSDAPASSTIPEQTHSAPPLESQN